MSYPPIPVIVVSSGEPAGIGPDIVLDALTNEPNLDACISVTGDPAVLRERAVCLGLDVCIRETDSTASVPVHQPGQIHVIPAPVSARVVPGTLNPENAASVIECIDLATRLCLQGKARAMVTAPVHKAAINDGGIAFQGHTEWIAKRTGCVLPVMMLASPALRVCLATTHIPLSAVPSAITHDLLTRILRIMDRDIGALYGIPHPEICVLGLNPHAGENGYLGREELDTIIPALNSLKASGLRLTGPLPADTAFTEHHLHRFDAVLAMYHDQGLPVIKHQGFGEIVNVTLGLPIVRTSVDHGTALDLAATGRASASSMVSAIRLAIGFAHNRVSESP